MTGADARESSDDDALSRVLDDVVRRFAGALRSAAVRFRLAPAEIDEAEQELRIRLWRACGSAENVAALSASYVQRVVTTTALDLLRRRRRAERLDDVAALPLVDPAPGADAGAEVASLADLVADALAALVPARRAVVTLYLEGHPREEIEAILGWSEGRTRNLLYRGLADLRAALEQRGVRWETE
ncbi:MAG: sigma-70 family RNA polymerase sigma factor [Gemmatimonadaceae bacterium]|nr:sigma-70 family RNA polymerase sigma factor [Gemmatimonadaceae bacterium]